jgi:hypothetical protein
MGELQEDRSTAGGDEDRFGCDAPDPATTCHAPKDTDTPRTARLATPGAWTGPPGWSE